MCVPEESTHCLLWLIFAFYPGEGQLPLCRPPLPPGFLGSKPPHPFTPSPKQPVRKKGPFGGRSGSTEAEGFRGEQTSPGVRSASGSQHRSGCLPTPGPTFHHSLPHPRTGLKSGRSSERGINDGPPVLKSPRVPRGLRGHPVGAQLPGGRGGESRPMEPGNRARAASLPPGGRGAPHLPAPSRARARPSRPLPRLQAGPAGESAPRSGSGPAAEPGEVAGWWAAECGASGPVRPG